MHSEWNSAYFQNMQKYLGFQFLDKFKTKIENILLRNSDGFFRPNQLERKISSKKFVDKIFNQLLQFSKCV